MRIGLDFDGTIANWGGAMNRWLEEHVGRPLDRERNVTEQVTRAQLQTMVGAILGTALTFEMEPNDGALAVMSRLAVTHELLVITARHDGEAAFAAEWLERHGAPVLDVVSTGRALKAETCRLRAIDVLLDDTAEHLLALGSTGTVPVLFRGRFGSQQAPPQFVHIVDHWQAFEALCSRLGDAGADAPPEDGPTAPLGTGR